MPIDTKCQQLGQAARAFALAHCTLDAMCDAMEEVFGQAVAGKR